MTCLLQPTYLLPATRARTVSTKEGNPTAEYAVQEDRCCPHPCPARRGRRATHALRATMFHQLHQVGRTQVWHEEVQTEQVQHQQHGKGASRGTHEVWPMKPMYLLLARRASTGPPPAEQTYRMCPAMLQQEGGNRPT